MNLKSWNIYHGSREYARELGDPLLGIVEAETKEEAERIAHKTCKGGEAGYHAVCSLARSSRQPQ